MTYKSPIKPYRHRTLRERINRHLKDIEMTARQAKCGQRREGDEIVCHCGLRWQADEDRPQCPLQGLSA